MKIQVENSKGKQKEGFNYYDSGIIIGTKNLKEKDSNEKKNIIEIKEPKIELEGKGNVNIPNPEIKGGNIEENINQPNPNADIKLESNPEFTSSVLIAYARACYRLNKEGNYGCKTVFDIPPAYLSSKTSEELRKTML